MFFFGYEFLSRNPSKELVERSAHLDLPDGGAAPSIFRGIPRWKTPHFYQETMDFGGETMDLLKENHGFIRLFVVCLPHGKVDDEKWEATIHGNFLSKTLSV